MNKQERDIVEIALRILGCPHSSAWEKHIELHGMTMVVIPMGVSSKEFTDIRLVALRMVMDEECPGWRDDG